VGAAGATTVLALILNIILADLPLINEFCIALFANISTNRFRFRCVIFALLIIEKNTKNCIFHT